MMESLSSIQRDITLHTLKQIRDALFNLMEWNREVGSMDLLMATPGGMQKLAGNCPIIMHLITRVIHMRHVEVIKDYILQNYGK